MVTGLYAALAASASVFIGILTALLASDLSNLRAEQSRINRRIKTIDARLQSLDDQFQTLQDRVNEVADHLQAQQLQDEAETEVDEFIEEYVGEEFNIPPEDLSGERLQNEFLAFLDQNELNQFQLQELQENLDEIETKLSRSQSPSFLTEPMLSAPISNPEVSAMYDQIDHQWRIHNEERYNRDFRQFVQTVTEIRSLQRERQRLKQRYESLDPSEIKNTLKASVVTIGLSIGFPLLVYFLRVTLEEPLTDLPMYFETSSVFGLWVIGLGWVFNHLWGKLKDDSEDLDDEPELSINEDMEDVPSDADSSGDGSE